MNASRRRSTATTPAKPSSFGSYVLRFVQCENINQAIKSSDHAASISVMKGPKLVQTLVAVILPPFLLTIALIIRLSHSSADMVDLPAGPYPGDDVISDPVMIYDQKSRLIHAPPSDVWPWILQVGKGRGGWYAPSSWEKYMPKTWQAAREINPAWQRLRLGDKVDDYGFSADDHFVVVDIQPERALVYSGDRYGARFSWSIIVHELSGHGQPVTLVHLRFRGKIAATGLKKRFLVRGGGVLDHLTTAPMLAGLAERAEHSR